MPKHNLSPKAIRQIESLFDTLYDKIKAKFLGPASIKNKQLVITVDPYLSLPGIATQAAIEEGTVLNKDSLMSIIRTAANYLDSDKEKTKAKVINTVQSYLSGTSLGAEDIPDIRSELDTVIGQASANVNRILSTESQNAKNVSLLDGVIKMNNNLGVDDPTLFWVGVLDSSRCEDCWRLFTLEDRTTPRVWKLSEVGHGYYKKGENRPCFSLHPNCRCTVSTLLPGYGFVNGKVTFISLGYDEFAKQRA